MKFPVKNTSVMKSALMRGVRPAIAAAATGLLVPCTGVCADTTQALTQTPASTPVAPSTADDRIAISGNGSTLTGTDGGGGGSVGWLHNFDADTLVGAAVEHQALSVAHWTFASLNGALTRGSGDARYSVYAEAHEGTGNDGPRHFDYNVESLGLIGTYFHRFSAQVEDRQIEVEKTHGNLPKLGVSYLWNPHILTSLSYTHSVSGDLGTRLTSGRFDIYGAALNYLAGFSFGQASPAVLGQGTVLAPGQRLKEGYVGATRSFPQWRGDLTAVVDYQDLSGSKRATLTLNYIFHVGHNGRPK
jgi:hypothetical protein